MTAIPSAEQGADGLPIAAVAPALRSRFAAAGNFVVLAEPGAGKTTVVPQLLLDAIANDGRQILVSQPRRIAARLSAHRVASLMGEPVGRRVGYQVRFESAISSATRIVFVTEGLLARRLRNDPQLGGVAAVIIDEFHERHVDTDLCLALLRRLQRTSRPNLCLGVMSATFDPGPVAKFLECAPVACEGRSHPVTVEYDEDTSDRPLSIRVAKAVRRLAERTAERGSILVFLAGAREIRAVARGCEAVARHAGLEVVALHGDLSPAEQDRVVRPGDGFKLILATNIAETSVTLADVVAVIDSGWVRRPRHDPGSGIPTLALAKISRASAAQRAGRAGRVRPGCCVRLYGHHDFQRRPPFDLPEIQRFDLAAAALDLRAAGISDPGQLAWFEAPPDAALRAADALLTRLEAIDDLGNLTATGTRMLAFPIHPRLARVMVEAERRGIPEFGAGAAALLSERSIRRFDRDAVASTVAGSDVFADLEQLDAIGGGGVSPGEGTDRGAASRVIRVRRQLQRLAGRVAKPPPDLDEARGLALLAGFGDRVGRFRGRELVLAGGGSARLAEDSVVHGARFGLALVVEERRDAGQAPQTVVRSAAELEPEWLLELFPERLEDLVRCTFNPDRQRVEAVRELRYDGMVIDATDLPSLPPEAQAVLRDAALAAGLETFVDIERLRMLEARTRFAHAHAAEIPAIDAAAARRALERACAGKTGFADLRGHDILETLVNELPGTARAALERLAPNYATLANGRRLTIHYELDRPPWVESFLQDFFGLVRGPAVASERVPLVLHLLAPNRRAVQVTTDLEGFWDRHYPELRRQLMRRYPKHAWPDDPRTAAAPRPRGRRRP